MRADGKFQNDDEKKLFVVGAVLLSARVVSMDKTEVVVTLCQLITLRRLFVSTVIHSFSKQPTASIIVALSFLRYCNYFLFVKMSNDISSPTPKKGAATPQRTPARNNYAAPHTPIASAKRPRSSGDKSMMSPAGNKSSLPSTPLIPPPMEEDNEDGTKTPVAAKEKLDRSQMSPMHPPRPLVIHEHEEEEHNEEGSWVGRKVDALFSPMLNLLGHGEDGEEGEEHPVEDDAAKPAASDSATSQTASHETTSHGDGDEEEVEEPDAEYHEHHVDHEEDNVLVDDDNSSQGTLDEEDEFNPYVFIKSLPTYDLVAPLRPPIALPPKDKNLPPISLVLDLDETLVHCTVEPVDDADLVFPVVFHGMTYQVHVRLRPHLFEFLKKIKGKYEVIVFTASQKVYANELLNLIDPGTFLFSSHLSVEGFILSVPFFY